MVIGPEQHAHHQNGSQESAVRESALSISSHVFEELPPEWTYDQVLSYMKENGVERAFQNNVNVPVDQIYVDEDVVDRDHLPEIRKYDLDRQVEPVSLAAVVNIDGKEYYEVTNGLHRITVRREQGAHLSIKACVRYGMSDSEINEMRLKDLNSKLSAVLFLRIARWLTAAFANRSWKNESLNEVVYSGQISIVEAIDFVAHKAARTNFKILVDNTTRTLSQTEKDEIVAWTEEVTWSIDVSPQQLRNYMAVAAVSPEALIEKMAQIKSGGGGKEGKGKITFDLLKLFANVFAEKYEDLQLLVADACIHQNITASAMKDTPVLQDIKKLYLQSNGNLLDPDLLEYVSELKKKCLAAHQPVFISRGAQERLTHEAVRQQPSTPRIGETRVFESAAPKKSQHTLRVEKFWDSRMRMEESGTDSQLIMVQLGHGHDDFGILDVASGILVAKDDRLSAYFTPTEIKLLLIAKSKGKSPQALSPDELLTAFREHEYPVTTITAVITSLGVKVVELMAKLGKLESGKV